MDMPQLCSIRDVAPEAVMLAGAGRAILLQLANPAVGYGVARHSSFATDPLKRLHGTLSYIYALTNGTPQQQASVTAQVHKAHRPVTSQATPEYPAYDAQDPSLQLWVAATLYDSAMIVHRQVFGPLPPEHAESLYRDYGILGTALGMPATLWPATTADFDDYWNREIQRLRVDDTIRGVAGELLAARAAPWWIKMLMPVARFLTAGLLPASVRVLFGLAWSPARERGLGLFFRAARILVKVLPKRIRHAPMHFYLKRIPG